MPTIKQLPVATSVAATDLLPVSQGGVTRGLTISGLLSSTQLAIALAPSKLLGRVSGTAGGPEPVSVGAGLAVVSGTLVGTGADHASLPIATALEARDEVIVNSQGSPRRMPSTLLRNLFSAGNGVTIDSSGLISASSVTLTVATPETLGGVKVGSGLSVSTSGTLAVSSVWDYGVAPNTATDQVSAFGLAVESTAVSLSVPPGDYHISGVVELGSNQTMELTGTKFSGTGVIADGVDWSAFFNRTTKAWLRKSNESSNAFGTITTMDVGVSGSTVSYEKAAGYDIAITADPSSYSGGGTAWADVSTLDAVGRQMNGIIRSGNLTGRVWGLTAGAQVPAGGNGTAAAAEFDVVNDSGIDQPYVKQPTSKTGIGLIALGNTPSTTAAIVAAGGTTWHDGYVVLQEAVSDKAFRIIKAGSVTEDTFHVTPDGAILAQAGIFLEGLKAPTPTTQDNSTQVATTAFVQATMQGGSALPIQEITVAGTTQTLRFSPGSRETSVAITLDCSCMITIAGGTPGFDQLMTIELLQGGNGGNSPTFANVSWTSGTQPVFNTLVGRRDTIQLRTIGVDLMGWPVSLGRTPLLPSVPSAPNSITVTAGSQQNSVTVPPVAAIPAVTGYNVYATNTSGIYSAIPVASNVALPFTETGQSLGSTRFYRVAAINSSGIGAMSPEGLGVTPPAAALVNVTSPSPVPNVITVTPGIQSNIINVIGINSLAVGRYTIFRGVNPGGEEAVPIAISVSVPYLDTGLIAGITYFYTVAAVTSNGTGPASSEASATPVAPVATRHYADFTTSDSVLFANPSVLFNPAGNPFDVQVFVGVSKWTVGGTVETNLLGCWDIHQANRLWRLGLTTDGRVRASWAVSLNGNPTATSSVALGVNDATDLWIRAAVTPTTGLVIFYTSIDGDNWLQLGMPQIANGSGAVHLPDNLPYLVIGANASAPAGPLAEQFIGKFYEARMFINGLLVTEPAVGINGIVDAKGFVYSKTMNVNYI